jgi:hypothetical protein
MKDSMDDILVVIGSGILVYATSLWSVIGAWYAAGIILIISGIVIGLGRKPK